MKSFDIVAYTYKAQILCPECTAAQVAKAIDWTGNIVMPMMDAETVEEYLDRAAGFLQVDDREDEWSFNSWDFPKVVFADQIEQDEHCGQCGEEIG